MKMDQIAFYSLTEKGGMASLMIKESLGLIDKHWIEDTVTCVNKVYPAYKQPIMGQAKGHLQYNYDLGIELEILRYNEGPSWHEHLPPLYSIINNTTGRPYLSHIGIHLADDEDFPAMLSWRLVQETKTKHHTNPYVNEKRRLYEFRIFESVPGTYLKFIKRKHY